MNIEYKRLPNDTYIITDEFGNIKKRISEPSRKELIIENKIETVGKNISDISKEFESYKSLTRLNQTILLGFSIPIVVAIIQTIFFKITFTPWIIPSLFNLCFGLTYIKCRKEKICLESKLNKAEELKEIYENELEKTKSLVIEKKLMINNPIDLTKQNEIEISKINDSLDEAYHNQKTKKLILKKRK